MTDIEPWIADLSKEKSLWDAFRTSRMIPVPEFNRRIRRFGYPLVMIGITILIWSVLDSRSSRLVIEAFSGTAVSVSATILGFLVAGLAIFTTFSDKKILIELAKTRISGTEISSFKYIYFNLLSTFVVYLSALAISAIIFSISKAEVEMGSFEIFEIVFDSAVLINGVVMSILVVISCECLIRIKSFIWNLYSSFLSIIFVSRELDKLG